MTIKLKTKYKMKNIKSILFTLITITYVSCSKDDDTKTISEATVDIHVVGNIMTEKSNLTKAIYWNNNLPTLLDQSENASTATAVVISNHDVYISGSLNYKACYWKNGNIVYLPDGTEALDIKVVDRDVYVAGENKYVACYWKNGIKTTLAETENESKANAITVVGNDIYVAGTQSLGKSKYNFLALYWKNNEAVILDDYQGFANDIAVNANDIYVAGDAYKNTFLNNAYFVYWKNNMEIYVGLEKSQNKVYTNGLEVDNNNVFAAGYIHSYGVHEAAYWKNGKTTLLANSGNSNYAEAKDIKVLDDIVFVCGYEKSSTKPSKPKIWINNEETILSGDIEEGEALGIFVVKN